MLVLPIWTIVCFWKHSLEVHFCINHMLPREAHFIRKGKF